jgi:hypothetical protein
VSWQLFTFSAVASRRPDRGFQRLFPVHEPLTLNSVERRLMALNSLRFCCATVAQNSRKFSGCGRGLKLCLGKMSDGKFAVLHQRHRCVHHWRAAKGDNWRQIASDKRCHIAASSLPLFVTFCRSDFSGFFQPLPRKEMVSIRKPLSRCFAPSPFPGWRERMATARRGRGRVLAVDGSQQG